MILDALGDPVRRRVVEILAGGERPAGAVSAVVEADDERADMLVSNERMQFRVTPAVVRRGADGTVELSRAAAEVLEVRPGQVVRYVPIRPPEGTQARELELFQSVPLPAGA